MNKHQIKISIFDLTDCEGCELQFLSLKEKFLQFVEDYEIASWRLVKPHTGALPKIDLAIVQGSVITQNDRNMIKKIRDNSKFLVALGECARSGWIPCWIKKENRKQAVKYVYGSNYQPKALDVLPLKAVVKVDLEIPGCPPDLKILEEFLQKIPELIKN